jgi:hypothetical protein
MALERNQVDDELGMLLEVPGVDQNKIKSQLGMEVLTPSTPPVTPPVTTPEVPPITPDEPPVTPTQPDIDQSQRDVFMKEIFGERFTSVEEVKKANIPSILDEVSSLRQAKTELETKLAKKPKSNFVNDEVALYNEFVRGTGISNFEVFSKVNAIEKVTDPMDILVTKYKTVHPELAGEEQKIRRYFERKYNVVSSPTAEQLEDPEFLAKQEDSKFEMATDAQLARKELMEMKGKIKLPEPEPETPEQKPKELTPEEKADRQSKWTKLGTVMSQKLSKLSIPMTGSENPLMVYELSEADQKEISDFVTSYAVGNQLELNETNIKALSGIAYNQVMVGKFPDIIRSVFEKVSKLTEAEMKSLYHNPSAKVIKNNDKPPTPPVTPQTEMERKSVAAFDLEMQGL